MAARVNLGFFVAGGHGREQLRSKLLNPLDVVEALRKVLSAGMQVTAEVCPHCSTAVVSGLQPSTDHNCAICSYRFSTSEPVVSYPLAEFAPMLTDDGRLKLLLTFSLLRWHKQNAGKP